MPRTLFLTVVFPHIQSIEMFATIYTFFLRYLISNCFRDAKLHFDRIKEQAIYWKKTIDLSDDEYNEINPEKILFQILLVKINVKK